MKTWMIGIALAAAASACSVQDRTTVQPTPATATTTTYSTPAPASTTYVTPAAPASATTVYTR